MPLSPGNNLPSGALLGPTQAGKRTQEVVPLTAGHPRFRAQSGRKGQGLSRVRYRPQHQRRGRTCRGTSCVAASCAGSARNSQRTPGRRQQPSQGRQNAAGPHAACPQLGGIPPSGPQVLPPIAEWIRESPLLARETRFCGVKRFSYSLSQSCCMLGRGQRLARTTHVIS